MRRMTYETFDDFVARGAPKLLGAAILLVGDQSTAEDLTQETLIRVYGAWGSIRSDAAVDSYAYRTLVRLTGRRRRRASTRNEIPTARPPDAMIEPSDADQAEELWRQVDALIPQLPPRQRGTLMLRYYAGLSVDQTATVMGCSPGTVKSQTAKGLRNLKKLIASPTIETSPGRETTHDHSR
jgi:RNA polymerase sigma-70 factor (sigma-E family)